MRNNYYQCALCLAIFMSMLFGKGITAQPLPNYPLKFQFQDASGNVHDTIMSRIRYKYWSVSPSYPAYVKWKNEPFAVLKSTLQGVGLFTDSASSFNTGDTIGYAFFKVGNSGSFDVDYLETNVGSFVNDSTVSNMSVSLTSKGILMQAKQSIGPNTELTANYRDIINLFPNDQTVQRVIQYW